MIIVFSFQAGFNFLTKACLFLCFENALKFFLIFLLFSLLQINIFDVFVFFLNILRLSLAAQPDPRRIY